MTHLVRIFLGKNETQACKTLNIRRTFNKSLVPKVGLEPTREFTSADFESAASANSATSA